MKPEQYQFLLAAAEAAVAAKHLFPRMAAAEAALESAYGTSELAVRDKNLFGMKQHTHPIYGTHILPTREVENGEWITINSSWISYPTIAACFADRMATLIRLAPRLPHYAAALNAPTPQAYIEAVSRTWSTDPSRADHVLKIFDEAGL